MRWALGGLLALGSLATTFYSSELFDGFADIIDEIHHKKHKHAPHNAKDIVARCEELRLSSTGSGLDDFARRSISDRFEENTRPVLIKNAKIWTGRRNGTHVVEGDILLDKGLIKDVGNLDVASLQQSFGRRLLVHDVHGAWITPGIIDADSHIGNAPSPALKGAQDYDSEKSTIAPWLRTLDGLNTHDDSYMLSIAGGVTTALVLPGSSDAIGGQAYVVKLRQTSERSPSSMLVEPPHHINSSYPNPNLPSRWRHIKHACGEDPNDHFKSTRMDTIWALREAYSTAAKIKERQDEFCSHALAKKVNWRDLGEFPDPLHWEALVDVLRGKMKVHVQCDESVDLDAMVRLSNEFKFPIAAFHHASEAFLVPEVLKRAYGKTPAVALFATNAREKRESYRASEFAPRLLAQHGIDVIMKSGHTVQDSRHLLYEAQQAFYYGLPWNLALASVTTRPAKVMGMAHRVGYIKDGADADLVVWDSHPLALGATPAQAYIDGIPQLQSPYVAKKPNNYQRLPKVPNFDKEANRVGRYDGLPPLESKKRPADTVMVFTNVERLMTRTDSGLSSVSLLSNDSNASGMVVVRSGVVVCAGQEAACDLADLKDGGADARFVDLDGGSISPGFLHYGSPLGLRHIDAEDSTNDGTVLDPLTKPPPDIIGGSNSIMQASDGLEFASRDALLAFRTGVTSAVVAPKSDGFYGGLGVHFSTGASHAMEQGAILQEVTAVHVAVRHIGNPSVSTQIAALRRLLSGEAEGPAGYYFGQVRSGDIPLVVEAHSADIIATLLILKQQIERDTGRSMRMTVAGASEAHILAKELAQNGVGVILSPSRPFPYAWEDRRILPGPPLTGQTALMVLLDAGVLVGIGSQKKWDARNLPFDLTWAAIDAGGRLGREEAFAIGSSNLETLLGVRRRDPNLVDLVAARGGDLLDSSSKVVAVISPGRKGVYLIEDDF